MTGCACIQVWTFVLSNASFKTSHSLLYVPDVTVDKIKIVCVDSRIVQQNPEGEAGAAPNTKQEEGQ